MHPVGGVFSYDRGPESRVWRSTHTFSLCATRWAYVSLVHTRFELGVFFRMIEVPSPEYDDHYTAVTIAQTRRIYLFNPFRTAVPFWAQTTHILSTVVSPPNGTPALKGFMYFIHLVHIWRTYCITWYLVQLHHNNMYLVPGTLVFHNGGLVFAYFFFFVLSKVELKFAVFNN